MAVCIYEQQLDYLKNILKKSSFHPYFSQYLKPPVIDEDRILLLAYTLHDASLPKDEYETYISAAMLAHFALDMHESVTMSDTTLKEKQLGILAGDYYSGQYYKLLAGYKNIELIKVLAEAIKSINEQKIYLYENKEKNIDSFMSSVKEVEASLLANFSLFFTQSSLYSEFIEEFLFVKKLVFEMENLLIGKQTIFTHNIRQCTSLENSELYDECHKYLNQSKTKLDEMMMSLSSLPSIVKVRLNNLTNHFK